MLKFVNTSLLSSNVQTVVNTVNTVGVMGKGLAAEFKARAPDMYKQYRILCDKNLFKVGQLWLWKKQPQWILNFPTKEHWKNPSRIEYIEAGLIKFVEKYEEQGIREISFPRLGCGNGGLNWDEVRPLMERHLGKLPITILIHDFMADIGTSEHNLTTSHQAVSMSFAAFLNDLRILVAERQGHFHTISSGGSFNVSIDTDDVITIRPVSSTRPSRILPDDLFEAWQMLLHGPLTRTRLVGSCFSAASYLLGLIATLPYTRPILLRNQADDIPTQAVELLDDQVAVEQLFMTPTKTNLQEALWA
jgi:O-acetyl-ADP-ribose deacetylase (regulator of RNase III)